MKNWITISLIIILIMIAGAGGIFLNKPKIQKVSLQSDQQKVAQNYWFMLHRKSKKEFLYQGIPGDLANSTLVKEFQVNVGIEGQRPTPLPELVGRAYWNLIAEYDTAADPETAP